MASASPDARLVGDRYELGELLGHGGMADVHRATDRLLHREVAVKELRDTVGAGGDPTDRARFTGEARTLAGLSHPGLVMVLDAGLAGRAGTTSERPWLVMELVEGTTLADVVRGGPLPPERVREIGARVADALGYAHERGVVHRDVKPSNVLLDGTGRVKLADFGIAKLLGDDAQHTRTGMTIGSAAYLSPEQVRGEPVTGAADVYSLGLVLLEALTGERAYPGPPMEAAVARLHRPAEVPASVPAGWRALLADLLLDEAAARPAAPDAARRLRSLADDAGTTRPLTGLAPAPPVPARVPAPGPAGPSRIDRAGDALAGGARTAYVRVRDRVVALQPHERGVALAVLALVLLLVAVGLASGAGGGSGPDELPADTPPRLEQPLQDLHDAVDGRTP